MEVLSESTPITIGLAASALGVMAWLSRVHYVTSENHRRVEALEQLYQDLLKDRRDIGERLARIETSLASLPEIKALMADVLSKALDMAKANKG